MDYSKKLPLEDDLMELMEYSLYPTIFCSTYVSDVIVHRILFSSSCYTTTRLRLRYGASFEKPQKR